MNSNVPKFDYFEMPLKDFIKKHSDFVKYLPSEIDLNDSDYIVRFKNGIFEIGYSSDDWVLNQK